MLVLAVRAVLVDIDIDLALHQCLPLLGLGGATAEKVRMGGLGGVGIRVEHVGASPGDEDEIDIFLFAAQLCPRQPDAPSAVDQTVRSRRALAPVNLPCEKYLGELVNSIGTAVASNRSPGEFAHTTDLAPLAKCAHSAEHFLGTSRGQACSSRRFHHLRCVILPAVGVPTTYQEFVDAEIDISAVVAEVRGSIAPIVGPDQCRASAVAV